MGYISKETIDQIMQRADIVDIARSFVTVKRKGHDYWCCCPFHKEKTESCKFNQTLQGFYCFGCKEHGTLITFVMKMVNTDYPGALRWLAERLGITVVEEERSGQSSEEGARLRALREKRQCLLNDAANWYHSLLQSPEAAPARSYLEGRGLDAAAVSQFKLGFSYDSWDALIRWAQSFGYSLDDLKATSLVKTKEETGRSFDFFRGRLMFPIWDELGKVAGFSARILDPEVKTQKYINSLDSDFFHKGNLLYALNFARPHLKDMGALICEGQLDVIACHRAGLVNAMASEGTAFTEQHARQLKKSTNKAVLCFDADTAGYKAAEKTIAILHQVGFDVSVVTLPAGEDPDSVFRKGGAEGLRRAMSLTEPAIPYLFRVSCLQDDIASPNGKSVIARRVLQAVVPISDPIVRRAHCQWLAQRMNLPEDIIVGSMNNVQEQVQAQSGYRGFRPVQKQPMPPPWDGGGMNGPVQGAPQVAPPPAPVVVNSLDTLCGLLLDLVLHVEVHAKELAFMSDFLAWIPKTPVGQAIMLVVVLAEQDEWGTAMEALQASPCIADPIVGRAVFASECLDDKGTVTEASKKAFTDCVTRIQKQHLSDLIVQRQNEMMTEADPEKRKALYEEINGLIRQKKMGTTSLI